MRGTRGTSVGGRRLLGVVGCLLVLGLAGCGGDEADRPAGDSASSTPAEQTPAPLSPAAQARADARQRRLERLELERSFAPNPWREPAASPPHPHEPVRRLIVHDVKRGRGPALRGDETVYADFVKTYWRNGRKFLVAWGPQRAEYLELRSQAPGISRGMTGMRLGGRRTIAMPRAIGDVHAPNGEATWEEAHVDIVLRKIVVPAR
jgi:hypothetical protein